LNKILILTAFFTLFVSILAGFWIARRLSRPILITAETARKISEGDYEVRIKEETNTKELDQLIGAINQLGESLKNQEDLRKQLTADVAHELRTPITTAQTHLEAMIEGCWEPTKDRLQSCYDEMTRISRLVRDLENLAKVESGNSKLDRSMISLMELSNNVVLNFEAELKNKDLRTSVEGSDSMIFADKYRIEQVLMNLMSNAIKYTLEGGNINIRISESETSVIFEFEDNGIGIPEEELPLIFERFYRADKSRNRMTGGSGIGLAIVRSIVAAHGGTVEVKSRLNSGTCFTLTYPKTSI
ncbi:MAG: HAMP domain-containing sensor histidine kinase, partial [Synergistaceae bacterium]|nr:HAMP domain-containing sensor histidine kinase [Synergistaceae bacterium]